MASFSTPAVTFGANPFRKLKKKKVFYSDVIKPPGFSERFKMKVKKVSPPAVLLALFMTNGVLLSGWAIKSESDRYRQVSSYETQMRDTFNNSAAEMELLHKVLKGKNPELTHPDILYDAYRRIHWRQPKEQVALLLSALENPDQDVIYYVNHVTLPRIAASMTDPNVQKDLDALLRIAIMKEQSGYLSSDSFDKSRSILARLREYAGLTPPATGVPGGATIGPAPKTP